MQQSKRTFATPAAVEPPRFACEACREKNASKFPRSVFAVLRSEITPQSLLRFVKEHPVETEILLTVDV